VRAEELPIDNAGHYFVVNSDGSGLRQLNPPETRSGNTGMPTISLSPDGRQAAFGVDGAVWIVDLDGGEAPPHGLCLGGLLLATGADLVRERCERMFWPATLDLDARAVGSACLGQPPVASLLGGESGRGAAKALKTPSRGQRGLCGVPRLIQCRHAAASIAASLTRSEATSTGHFCGQTASRGRLLRRSSGRLTF
jgi:hypothetical protein